MHTKLNTDSFYKLICEEREKQGLNGNYEEEHLNSVSSSFIETLNLDDKDKTEIKEKFLCLMATLFVNPRQDFTNIDFKFWLFETKIFEALKIDIDISKDIVMKKSGKTSFVEMTELFLNNVRQN